MPTRPSEPKIPLDLKKALSASLGTMTTWESLTPIARRDWISWIESAKLPETRNRRVDSIGSRLASGKRRPCCYALVPMNLYKALGANQKAKATWSTLTPDERRDFIAWIDSTAGTQARELRIAKVCTLLATGKRRT